MPVLSLETREGHRYTLNLRRESTVLMDAEHHNPIFSFDSEGRLVGAFVDARNYRRSFANRILEKQSGPRPGLSGRLRRMLAQPEVKELEDRAYTFARTLGAVTRSPLPPEAEVALAKIGSYDFERLESEREVYQDIYRPVTILPPDQYLALYLQATEGCSFNDCSFCGFYRDRRFHIKTIKEFREHIRRVRGFLRGGLSLRRSIFLGDANALMLSQPTLTLMFDVINTEFAVLPPGLTKTERAAWRTDNPVHFDGIYSFIDAFATRRKTATDYHELAMRGLKRVYVGLESGDMLLLQFLGKPNTPEDVIRLVQQLKEGGVAVGVIVLVGAGGKQYQDRHVTETARIINALPLDEKDLVYFSELVDFPSSTYSARAADAGILPLAPDEIEQQRIRTHSLFRFPDLAHPPRVSHYDIREFIY